MQKIILMILLTWSATPAVADLWESTADSKLTFVAQLDGAELKGTFTVFDVKLTTVADGSGLEGFEVVVNLGEADLGDPDTNAVLFNPAWFHINKYPNAIFKTSKIDKRSETLFDVTGELDLKGTKKSLHFTIDFQNRENSASITGSTSINRNDFDVGSGEWASDESVGVTVKLNFNVRLDRVH